MGMREGRKRFVLDMLMVTMPVTPSSEIPQYQRRVCPSAKDSYQPVLHYPSSLLSALGHL